MRDNRGQAGTNEDMRKCRCLRSKRSRLRNNDFANLPPQECLPANPRH
jgi:hypothetical protein